MFFYQFTDILTVFDCFLSLMTGIVKLTDIVKLTGIVKLTLLNCLISLDKKEITFMTHPLSEQTNSKKPTQWIGILLLMVGFLGMALMAWQLFKPTQPNPVEAISRDGVVSQIQQLNRLQTVAYSVDTVITSEKQGTWYSLWQDKQKGLFIAHGRVNAGVDLAKLTPQMITLNPIVPEVSDSQANHNQIANQVTSLDNANIHITLPPAQIFDVYLDDIELYDWKTGVFGMLQADPAILKEAQSVGKSQVLKQACQGSILKLATDNAKVQVEQLFEMTGARVTVAVSPSQSC